MLAYWLREDGAQSDCFVSVTIKVSQGLAKSSHEFECCEREREFLEWKVGEHLRSRVSKRQAALVHPRARRAKDDASREIKRVIDISLSREHTIMPLQAIRTVAQGQVSRDSVGCSRGPCTDRSLRRMALAHSSYNARSSTFTTVIGLGAQGG